MSLLVSGGALLALVDAMAATLQLHDLGVGEEAVKQDAGGDVVAEHGAEVFDGSVAGQDGGAGFVTAAEDLEQVFGRSRRQRAQAEVLEDEQVDAAQARDHLLTSAGCGGLGKILGEVEGGAVEPLPQPETKLLEKQGSPRTRTISLRGAPYFLKVYGLTACPSCPTTRASRRF
jgi:hypothetical protein